jgi:hypothetical protein
MSFKSNFNRISLGKNSPDISVHGVSNEELIKAAETVYVALCPMPPAAAAITWKTVERGAQWSTAYSGEQIQLGEQRLVIGVALMKDPKESFVWGDVMSVERDDEPLKNGDDDPEDPERLMP